MIRYVMSALMDGTTALVEMDSLCTKMNILAMVCVRVWDGAIMSQCSQVG